MYRIEHNSDHLLVKFIDDFDFNTVEVIIHHLMLMKEYPDTNDIWLIGNHRADIRLVLEGHHRVCLPPAAD